MMVSAFLGEVLVVVAAFVDPCTCKVLQKLDCTGGVH